MSNYLSVDQLFSEWMQDPAMWPAMFEAQERIWWFMEDCFSTTGRKIVNVSDLSREVLAQWSVGDVLQARAMRAGV